MSRFRLLCVLLSILFLFGCQSFTTLLLGGQSFAELIEGDHGAFIQSKYSVKMVTPALYLLSYKYRFDHIVTNLKEALLTSKEIPEIERELAFEDLSRLQYEESRYLIYQITLYSPIPLSAGDASFVFNGKSGSSAINKIYFWGGKELSSNQYGTTVFYQYVWLMQLNSIYNTDNFGKDNNVIEVNLLNQKARYRLNGS